MLAMKSAREIWEHMAPLAAPLLEQAFGRRDLCILATRVAIETAAYFGVEASALPVKAMVYNAAFARHVANGFAGVDRSRPATWRDGAWSVGIGFGKPYDDMPGRWDGHLIAVADGCFADFAIQQAERLQHHICIGTAVIGPYAGEASWQLIQDETGTVIEYSRVTDNFWRNAPDWKDAVRRRPVVAKLIRAVRETEVHR